MTYRETVKFLCKDIIETHDEESNFDDTLDIYIEGLIKDIMDGCHKMRK